MTNLSLRKGHCRKSVARLTETINLSHRRRLHRKSAAKGTVMITSSRRKRLRRKTDKGINVYLQPYQSLATNLSSRQERSEVERSAVSFILPASSWHRDLLGCRYRRAQ